MMAYFCWVLMPWIFVPFGWRIIYLFMYLNDYTVWFLVFLKIIYLRSDQHQNYWLYKNKSFKKKFHVWRFPNNLEKEKKKLTKMFATILLVILVKKKMIKLYKLIKYLKKDSYHLCLFIPLCFNSVNAATWVYITIFLE